MILASLGQFLLIKTKRIAKTYEPIGVKVIIDDFVSTS